MKLLRFVVFTLALCGFTAPLFATPLTYEFTVTATSGPLTPQTATGHFTFDSANIVPGTTKNQIGLLTALDFVWNGITYTELTANTGSLGWDASGALTSAFFGTDCGAGVCTINNASNDWHFSVSPFGGSFSYLVPGEPLSFNGNPASMLLAPLGPGPGPAVPEPTSLLLLGTGVASAMAARRRKKRSA